MARHKRLDRLLELEAVPPLQLSEATKKELTNEYLALDSGNVQRLAKLLCVEPTEGAIQAEAISRIETEIVWFRTMTETGNASLSESDSPGRPPQDARKRMVQTLRNVFWLFNPEEPEDKVETRGSMRRHTSRTNDLYEFIRIILQGAGIEMPKRREGHNDDLNDWMKSTTPRETIGKRMDLYEKADAEAPNRKVHTQWKMPPRVRRIPPRVCRVRPYVCRARPLVRRALPSNRRMRRLLVEPRCDEDD